MPYSALRTIEAGQLLRADIDTNQAILQEALAQCGVDDATELVEALLRRGMQAQDIIDNAGLDYDEVAQDVPAMEPDLVQAVLGSVECL